MTYLLRTFQGQFSDIQGIVSHRNISKICLERGNIKYRICKALLRAGLPILLGTTVLFWFDIICLTELIFSGALRLEGYCVHYKSQRYRVFLIAKFSYFNESSFRSTMNIPSSRMSTTLYIFSCKNVPSISFQFPVIR